MSNRTNSNSINPFFLVSIYSQYNISTSSSTKSPHIPVLKTNIQKTNLIWVRVTAANGNTIEYGCCRFYMSLSNARWSSL